MPTINQLTNEQLQKAEVFQKIQDLGVDFIVNNNESDAYKLARVLEQRLALSDIASVNLSFYELYEDLIVKLKLISFDSLSNEDAVMIMKYHFTKFTDIEMDWESAVIGKMFTMELVLRDELRQKLKVAIEQNQEFIGSRKISEWLAEYNRIFDFRKRTTLNTREFIARQGGGLQLEDRVKLRTLLFIYDHYFLVTPMVPVYALDLVAEAPELIYGRGPELPPGQSIATPEDYKVKNPFQKTSAGPSVEGNTINLRK